MQRDAALLALYGIKLKKELKDSFIIQLKDINKTTKLSHVLYDKLIKAIVSNNIHEVRFSEIYFGIEFEFVGSGIARDFIAFNEAMLKLVSTQYKATLQYNNNAGDKWVLGRDTSINKKHSKLIFPIGYELSTPKLKFDKIEDLITLKTVIDYCKIFLHAEVNNSCGTHIHIGFTYDGIYKKDLQELLQNYFFMESSVFNPIVPYSRRENKFCKSTQIDLTCKYQKLSARYCQFHSNTDKCSSIHLECRQLEGTLNFNTIIYWLRLQVYIIYDLIDHCKDSTYMQSLIQKNIFDILFYYDFDSSMISFFIERVTRFDSSLVKNN